jgi:glycolate oxidase FAD binding subunit
MGVSRFTGALRRFAEEVGDTGPVAVVGGRTRWDLGGDLRAEARLVRAPSGVVEHRPEEMTVRVRAGTPVDELHAELAARGQRTGLARRGGTVGGALAVGENDVSVLGRGKVRDCLLQLRYVSADGAVVTGGGPTVKNVTGFDLPRLLVGSLGTLGLIGEVLLRTNPIPARSVWLRAEGVDPFAAFAGLAKPSAVLWDGHTSWVELEGHAADVEAQRVVLDRLAGGGGRWVECAGAPELPRHRWSYRPGQLRRLDRPALGPFVASIGVGMVYAGRPAPPPAAAASLAALAARVKREFDPSGRLNPGRTAGAVAA